MLAYPTNRDGAILTHVSRSGYLSVEFTYSRKNSSRDLAGTSHGKYLFIVAVV